MVMGDSDPTPVDNGTKLLELGNGNATDATGNPTTSSATFYGGVLVNNEPKPEVSLNDTVDVTGKIEVDCRHVGQSADIVVYASHIYGETTDWYMLNSDGNPVPWASATSDMPAVGELDAFKEEVLQKIHPVDMYDKKFVYTGELNIFFGYRIADGTVVTNGEPMRVSISESTSSEATTNEPITDESASNETATDESVANESTSNETATDEPVANESTSNETATEGSVSSTAPPVSGFWVTPN
jgi:hypothetical protein